ncbi:hypothetical protein GQ600_1640 [Phytophthora cactorum]|nr:hypothetical protein GQ600_1640 [Phytophthora cactorum]
MVIWTSLRLLRLVLAIAIILLGVSNGITAAHAIAETTTAESNLIHGAVRSYHAATRELSDQDSDEDRKGGRGEVVVEAEVVVGWRRSGWRRSGGGGRWTTYYYGGGNPSLGLMNTNGVTRYKEKKCNRFTNWFKRLFNKKIKKCPKKKEEDSRRLRG